WDARGASRSARPRRGAGGSARGLCLRSLSQGRSAPRFRERAETEHGVLGTDELSDSRLPQLHHRLHLFLAEGLPFGGALDLNDAARAGHDEIHVYLRLGILRV